MTDYTNWRRWTRNRLRKQGENVELFIGSVEQAIARYKTMVEDIKRLNHLSTRDTLKELIKPFLKLETSLEELDQGEQELLFKYISLSLPKTIVKAEEDFCELKKQLNDWRAVLTYISEHLHEKGHFVGDSNPNTLAQRTLEKSIFITYKTAFNLEALPTVKDKNFTVILKSILEELELPHSNMPTRIKETLISLQLK
ncbi:MAG: hypothetical protein DRR42_23195 [Gammaproteobacteria bacterium]|nr:MAG: hypothetical protein DRR42_23195 [Gammaproteobacteria bacterium]